MKKSNKAVFIGGEIYRQAAYGNNHPLTIQRVGPVMDVCRDMGWLDDEAFVESPQASWEELIRFHAPAYVDAVIEADQVGRANAKLRENGSLQRRCDSSVKGSKVIFCDFDYNFL